MPTKRAKELTSSPLFLEVFHFLRNYKLSDIAQAIALIETHSEDAKEIHGFTKHGPECYRADSSKQSLLKLLRSPLLTKRLKFEILKCVHAEKEPEPKRAIKADAPTYLYLIRNHRNGLTKIGHSRNPSQREKTLQSEEPELEMVFSTPAKPEDEERLHEYFSKNRVRGEWFNLSERQIKAITGGKV